MLLVYTHKITHRNKYIFNLLFKDILGINFMLTSDLELFKASTEEKISYTNNPVGDELFFVSRNLLFETGITEQNITVFEYNHYPAFFATGKVSAIPFDVLLPAFIWLAGMKNTFLISVMRMTASTQAIVWLLSTIFCKSR